MQVHSMQLGDETEQLSSAMVSPRSVINARAYFGDWATIISKYARIGFGAR